MINISILSLSEINTNSVTKSSSPLEKLNRSLRRSSPGKKVTWFRL